MERREEFILGILRGEEPDEDVAGERIEVEQGAGERAGPHDLHEAAH
jgi:hypothetical protein